MSRLFSPRLTNKTLIILLILTLCYLLFPQDFHEVKLGEEVDGFLNMYFIKISAQLKSPIIINESSPIQEIHQLLQTVFAIILFINIALTAINYCKLSFNRSQDTRIRARLYLKLKALMISHYHMSRYKGHFHCLSIN